MSESEQQKTTSNQTDLTQQQMVQLSQVKSEEKEKILQLFSPELRKEFESSYILEKLIENKLNFEKQCFWCKIATGYLFSIIATINGARVLSLWRFYPVKERIFNIFAIGLLYSFSWYSFKIGYDIYMGKSMQMIEYRPSLSQRLFGTYNMISTQSRQEYLEKQISYEEEKMALQKEFQEQKKNSNL